MKKLILGIILLLIAITIGYIIKQDPGYIIISYHNWSITTSLWVGIICIIILMIILNIIFSAIKYILSIKSLWGSWFTKRKQQKSLSQLDNCICYLMQENNSKAETILSSAYRNGLSELVYLFFMAQIAQQENNMPLRDQMLIKASKLSKHTNLPALQLLTKLQIEKSQWDEAITTANIIYKEDPKNTRTLLYFKKILVELKKWSTLKKIIPDLNKITKHISKQEIEELNLKIYTASINKIDNEKDLQKYWENIPHRFTSNSQLIYSYITAQLSFNNDQLVAGIIEKLLHKKWDSSLLAIYGDLNLSDSTNQLLVAEKYLSQHDSDDELLLCLANISIKNKLWAKAQGYLTACLQIKDSNKVMAKLADIYDIQGEASQALVIYKKIASNQ